MELFILTTHSVKRNPGLGTEMVNKSLEVLKKKDFSLCVTEATSYYSQKIFNRLGFETLSEVKYNDYEVDGEVVFKQHGPHQAVKLMAKQF